MNKETWQRLRNLALFKLWVTDKQLSKLWPFAAFVAALIFLIFAVGVLFFR